MYKEKFETGTLLLLLFAIMFTSEALGLFFFTLLRSAFVIYTNRKPPNKINEQTY